ncbi:hypothetical protein RMSM_05585 [Rhodopirellula maiorica SM1]|uniref:Uncharacterized protein n=1 Tax=Rhodopirellula maiorica SM1 TaxID=1265738 RepID=M5RQ25_9BACT|nr:hypothetical protein RMSM_05585 [Rhodopirellula maiorica SM1]
MPDSEKIRQKNGWQKNWVIRQLGIYLFATHVFAAVFFACRNTRGGSNRSADRIRKKTR